MASLVGHVAQYVDLDKKNSLLISAASIAFNPLMWNILARQEYHNKLLTRTFGGNSKVANYALAFAIFTGGLYRDWLFKQAITAQPSHPLLLTPFAQAVAWATLGWGNVLVVSSMYRLGIQGTYLGDYFGFLLEEMVTGFPFNVSASPMYWGSFLSFLGTGLLLAKPAGVLLAGWVYLVYHVALSLEDPFTASIYAKRDRERANGTNKTNGTNGTNGHAKKHN